MKYHSAVLEQTTALHSVQNKQKIKCTQSKRKQANEQTNRKISLPKTQMLAYFI